MHFVVQLSFLIPSFTWDCRETVVRVAGASDPGTLFAPNEILVRASTVVNSISSRKRGVERNSEWSFHRTIRRTTDLTALSQGATFGPRTARAQPLRTFPVGCNVEIAVKSDSQQHLWSFDP